MNTHTYNKSASRQGSFVHEQVIAPDRGAACSNMEWKEYFTYDAITGKLFWSPTSLNMYPSIRAKRSFARFVGREAGYRKFRRGGRAWRMSVEVYGVERAVHTIIWEMHNGTVPDGLLVDHRDRNPHNNRLENLRLATTSQNNANRGVQVNNMSGCKGVFWCKLTCKWGAQISHNRKKTIIGRFATKEEAQEAYRSAAIAAFGEFAYIP